MLSSAADALAPVGPFRPNDGVSTKPGRLQVGNPVRFDAFYGPADRAARDASADSWVRAGQKKGSAAACNDMHSKTRLTLAAP